MSVSVTYLVSLIVPSAVLLPIYGVTFRKVWLGTKFKLVIVQIGLLVTSNVGVIVMGIG